MKKEGDEGGKRVGDLIGEMGRERMNLRAKKTAGVLLVISAFICLVSALGSLAGYLPHALGPSIVLIVASILGFAIGALELRRA